MNRDEQLHVALVLTRMTELGANLYVKLSFYCYANKLMIHQPACK